MTPRVVVVGDAMLDVVVRPSASVAPTSDTPSRVRVGRGGAAANLAVAIASADPGLEVVYVAAVGDDAAGEIFRRELEECPVRGALEVLPGATGVVVALVGGDGERSMLTDRGVNPRLSREHVLRAFGDGVDHLHVSGYTVLDASTRDMVPELLAAARDRAATTSVDVCSVGPLREMGASAFVAAARGASMLFANEEEALELSGCGDVDAALEELGRHWDEVMVTRGPRGALVRRGETVLSEPAATGDAIDTTGAGDCATGTYLAGRLRQSDVATSLTSAMRAAALVVEGLGSRGQVRL